MSEKQAGRFQHQHFHYNHDRQVVQGRFYINGKVTRRNLYRYDELGLNKEGKPIKKGKAEAVRITKIIFSKWVELSKQIQEAEEKPKVDLNIIDLMDLWIKSNEKIGKALRTFEMYERMKKSYIDFVGKHKLPITPSHIETLKAGLLRKKKETTVNIHLRTLKTFLNWCVEHEYIDKYPKISMIKEIKRKPDVLTQEEIKALLELIDDKIAKNEDKRKTQCYKIHKRFVMLCIGCGLRRSEAFYLQWSDIDWEGRTLHIRSKAGFTVKEKKDKSTPIPKFLLDYLEKEYQTAEQRDEYIISRYLYSMPSAITKAIKRHLSDLKLGDRKIKACHGFRAGYASYLYDQGVDIETIRALMGHSSSNTTRIYISDEDLRKKTAIQNINFNL